MSLDHIYLTGHLNCSESVSQVVDDALKSATEAERKTSKDADESFKRAIDALSDYEKKCYSKETVSKRMAAAEANDKSSLTILNKLKEKLRVREGLQVSFAFSRTNIDPQLSVEEPTRTFEFLLHRSLLDDSPTIVKGEPAH